METIVLCRDCQLDYNGVWSLNNLYIIWWKMYGVFGSLFFERYVKGLGFNSTQSVDGRWWQKEVQRDHRKLEDSWAQMFEQRSNCICLYFVAGSCCVIFIFRYEIDFLCFEGNPIRRNDSFVSDYWCYCAFFFLTSKYLQNSHNYYCVKI